MFDKVVSITKLFSWLIKLKKKKKKSLVKKLYIEKKKIETTFSLDIKK